MKTLNVGFEDKEFNFLNKEKKKMNSKSWRDFILNKCGGKR